MNKIRIGRHFKEGCKHLIRNKWMTLISLLSVMVTLLIVGVFTTVLLNVNHITKGIEKNVEVVVYIDLETDNDTINQMRTQVKDMEKVRSVDFVDKDQGLKNLIDDLGEQGKAFESLKEDNPLNDTFIVQTFDPLDTKEISEEIKKMDNVEKVDYGEDMVETLFSVTKTVRNGGLILIVGLILTALLLIANTIKMTIEMRSEEIKIMRLVGATNLFIQIPFIIEGALLGIVGSLVPIIAMTIGYKSVVKSYEETISLNFAELLPVGDVIWPIIGLLLGISILIGMLGSMISIRRYLKA